MLKRPQVELVQTRVATLAQNRGDDAQNEVWTAKLSAERLKNDCGKSFEISRKVFCRSHSGVQFWFQSCFIVILYVILLLRLTQTNKLCSQTGL